MTKKGNRQVKFFLFLLLLAVFAYFAIGDQILLSPANNTFTNGTNDTISFSFNYTNTNLGAVNCSLLIDTLLVNQSAGMNRTPTANITTTIFANITLSEAAHNWTINCTNSSGSANVSQTFFFTVDRTKPAVFDVRPTGVPTFNVSNVITISANVTDTNLGAVNVTVNITIPNGTISRLQLFPDAGGKYNNTYPIPYSPNGTQSGTYTVLYAANDSANNGNTSITTTFSAVDPAPAVFDVSPISGTAFNTSNLITIYANVTHNTNVSFVKVNITYPNSSIDQLTLFNSTALRFNNTYTVPNTTGTYNVTFIANSTQNTFNTSIRTTFVVSDILKPAVSAVVPLTGNEDTAIVFNATVADNVGLNGLTCTLYINNSNNGSMVVGANGIANRSITFGAGSQWSVLANCSDAAGNYNDTSVALVNISDTTAPVLNNIASTVTSPTAATITWTTDKVANDTVFYNKTTSLETISSNTARVYSHSFSLTSLTNGTTYYYNVTSCDSANHCTTNGTFSFTLGQPAAQSSSSSTSSSHGSGGSYTSPTTTGTVGTEPIVDSITKLWDSISAGTSTMFSIDSTGIAFTEVSFSVGQAVSGSSSMKVSSLVGKPSTANSDAPGKIFSYIEVTKTVSDSNIASASIKFRVPKTWLSQNNVDKGTVSLYRFNSNAWSKLITSILKEDSNYVYFTSGTPGFSTFAIAGIQTAAAPAAQAPPAQETTPSAPAAQAPPVPSSKLNTPMIVVVALVVIVILYFTFKGKRKPHYH